MCPVRHILHFVFIFVRHICRTYHAILLNFCRTHLALSDISCVFLPFLSDISSCGHIWLCRTYLAGTGPTLDVSRAYTDCVEQPWCIDYISGTVCSGTQWACKARRTYSRLCLFTTRLNCREPIGSRPCSVHCPDYSMCTLTTRSRPSEYLNAIYLVSSFGDVYAPWCHLVFRHASVMTEVVIG